MGIKILMAKNEGENWKNLWFGLRDETLVFKWSWSYLEAVLEKREFQICVRKNPEFRAPSLDNCMVLAILSKVLSKIVYSPHHTTRGGPPLLSSKARHPLRITPKKKTSIEKIPLKDASLWCLHKKFKSPTPKSPIHSSLPPIRKHFPVLFHFPKG